MVDKNEMYVRNVIDFAGFRERSVARAQAISARSCRHCGAALLDGESDDDCSSNDAGLAAPRPRKFYAE